MSKITWKAEKRDINFCENNGKNPVVKRNGEDCLKEFK